MQVNMQEVHDLMSRIKKGVETTGVDGLLLVREDLQAEMAICAPTDTPLRNRLNRAEGNGKAHSWYKLKPTSHAEGNFLGTGPQEAFFEKGGLPNATTPQYDFVSAPYVQIGDVATVSIFDQMAGATYTDVKKHQIKTKMLNVALAEEWAIINGDSAVNPLQFDGLRKQITSNVTDLAGAAVTTDDINTVMQNIVTVGGKPQAVVLSYRDLRKINDEIFSSAYRLTQAGAGALSDIPSGINISAWNNNFGRVDLIGTRYLGPTGNSDILVIDDKTVLEDGNAIQMVDLMPMAAIDLALLQTAYRTLIAEFTVLQVTCSEYQGKLINAGD